MEAFRDRVQQAAGIRCRPEAGGRHLLYNPRTDELHVLGPVEKSVYDLCDGRTLDDLVEAARPLLIPLGVEGPEAPGQEILGFLAALSKRGLVEYR